MLRSSGLAVALLLGAYGLTAYGQGGGGSDPDAKGTVSFTVTKNEGGKIEVSITRSAAKDWTMGSVVLFAVPSTGGVILTTPAMFVPEVGQPDPTTGTASIDLANGNWYLWVNYSVTTNGPPSSSQYVASGLTSATVEKSPNALETPGGTIGFDADYPKRVSGGAGFTAKGKRVLVKDWKTDPANDTIVFYTVPNSGGMIRKMNVTSQDNWTTSPKTLYVPSSLTYNALVAHAIVYKTEKAQLIGSWVTDK